MLNEKIISQALKQSFPDPSDGARVEDLARSLSRTLSYDRDLRDEEPGAVADAVRDCVDTLDCAAALAAVRRRLRKAREAREAEEKRKSEALKHQAVNWGFFLRCWDAYRRDGDLCAVRILTVTFLARWLRETGEWVEPNELDWCAARAIRDAEDKGLSGKEKESFAQNAFNEALVLTVMRKFERSLQANPGKTAAFLDARRGEYEEYSVKNFGYAPDWAVGPATRLPYTTAIKKKTATNG